MALSFAELRKQKESAREKLNTELGKLQNNFSKQEEGFWEPTVDKAGNGYAVLRLLPAPQGEDVPFVRRWDHGFKGPTGKWYIELNRNTLGEDDPVSEMNSKLWEQGENSQGRKTVSGTTDQPGTKRRMHYIVNVYVVEDPEKPENNGKVFLWKIGKKIFDKFNDIMNPKFKDELAINPFDLWEGANFKLKIRKVEGYRNYDKSEFDRSTSGPLGGFDDTRLQRIWESEASLAAFIAPEKFKSYDDLKKKLNQVMDVNGTPATRAAREELPRQEYSEPKREESREPTRSPAPAEEDDESLEFFKRLV